MSPVRGAGRMPSLLCREQCDDCGQIPVEELAPKAHVTDAEMLAEAAEQIGRSRALRARLDAAYPDTLALGRRRAARPRVCADHWITFDGCQVCELTRERDEALAEIERWKSRCMAESE